MRMKLKDKTVIVTGGASGIGRAMAERFAAEGARVAVADLAGDGAAAVAQRIGGIAVACDVTKESDIQALVARAEAELGPLDLFCSNAGIGFGEPDHVASASDAEWRISWDVHVMAHVYAARAALPGMIERGGGYFLQTASAAGLLNQIGDAAYSTTKHAAIGFAEALAISHGDDGIKVSVLCPQYVATPMLGYANDALPDLSPGVISPQQVAAAVVEGLDAERFLILPHPVVEQYRQNKAANYDRWLGGMRKLRRGIVAETGATRVEDMHKLI
jgi:NAD(P)-dependent dehydrogenase (short-subunit alcohol dehydrogenase family)